MKDIFNYPRYAHKSPFAPDKVVKEFEDMRNMAELKALSKHSLEHPLDDKQYNRMMELKKLVFGGIK